MNSKYFMNEAINEAKKAYKKQEVPVGCVIVVDDKIVARAHNLRHNENNSLYHAEILAISRACKKLGRCILDDATIYVTLEPCIMCGGAIIQSRMKKLVYAKEEPKFGCVESNINLFTDYKFNHKVEVEKVPYGSEVEKIMVDFFKDLRKSKNPD